MDYRADIHIFGGHGMVGSAIKRKLESQGYGNIYAPGRGVVNLLKQDQVNWYFEKYKPHYVFLVAAKVGGIIGNRDHPADFGYQNIMIQSNVLQAAMLFKTHKLMFLGSSCIYPRDCPQPIKEEYLLSDYLEPSNEMYALAKIFGVKMCDAYRIQYNCNFISGMPCNLYGINDTFDDKNGHVIPALLQRFHKAKLNGDSEVICWGTGSPMREFLNVDDCADACAFLMKNYDEAGTVNIGTGQDCTIKQLCEMIKEVVGFEGELVWDTSKPDGTPRKLLDTTKINEMGWKPSIDFFEGLKQAYQWYLEKYN